eukprot:Sdes_comp18065_c0_seq1m7457
MKQKLESLFKSKGSFRNHGNLLFKTRLYENVMPANVSAINSVPDFIDKPEYYPHGTPFKKAPKEFFSYIAKKDMKDFAAACQLAKTMVEYAGSLVKQGVTTDFIDQCVHQAIIDSGAYPSPLHYCGFPKSICKSPLPSPPPHANANVPF